MHYRGARPQAASALVGRERDIVFVIDEHLDMQLGNERAETELRSGELFTCRGNHFTFTSRTTQIEFASLCQTLRNCETGARRQLIVRQGGNPRIVSISLLPPVINGSQRRSMRLLLVEIRDPMHPAAEPDSTLLRTAFDLTPSETELCLHLLRGGSFPDVCRAAGLSYENGRQKLKSIFLKTGTNSQSDLRAILIRF